MAQGTIKSFDREKGQGFLSVEGGKDVFFHSSAVEKGGSTPLKVGQRVEFEVTQGPKGPQAKNVRVVG